jgi:hypothetical protein
MGGDFNAYVDSYNSEVKAAPLVSVNHPLERMTTGMTFTAEAIYHLSDSFGIGVGSGFISASKTSTLMATLFIFNYAETLHPQISAVPLTLNLHYFQPIGSRVNFHAFVGPALYFSKVIYERRLNFPAELVNVLDSFKPEGTTALGFQGGLGLEIKLSDRVFLLAEACGRMLRISGLTGQETGSGTVGGLPLNAVRTSTLWYYESYGLAGTDINLSMETDRPSPLFARNVREAAFSLGGITFQAGLRIRL